jgi:uncharacterized protein YprB with RNaseH-like and TPR domain
MSKVLFLDIETVPEFKSLPDNLQSLYGKRFEREVKEFAKTYSISEDPLLSDTDYEEHFRKRAGLYAEFGKVACVSIGQKTATKFYVKTITGRNEKGVLMELSKAIEKSDCNSLCGHNGIEFDFPFLMRRYIINGLPIPAILNVAGLKPWETKFEDTMKMWSGSAWNYKCSLDLLAHCLGIPSPKKDMDGSMVADMYYGMFKDVQDDQLPFDAEETALRKIGEYCALDVITLYKVYCRIKGIEGVEDENIVRV